MSQTRTNSRSSRSYSRPSAVERTVHTNARLDKRDKMMAAQLDAELALAREDETAARTEAINQSVNESPELHSPLLASGPFVRIHPVRIHLGDPSPTFMVHATRNTRMAIPERAGTQVNVVHTDTFALIPSTQVRGTVGDDE